MFKSKLDLFNQEWIDTVFAERNKEYGAYDLRARQSRVTVRAFIIGAVVFILLVSLPLIVKTISNIAGGHKENLDKVVQVTELLPPPAPPKDFVPPPPPEVKTAVEIKKFTPPVVAPDDQAQEIVSQKELKDKIAGAQDVAASADGDVMIDEKPVEHKVAVKATEGQEIVDMTKVQVQPKFPGGMPKFFDYVMWNLSGITLDDNNELRMQFRFVIEKDGSLTDVRVLNDGGKPDIAERAVGVLQKSPKWEPGVMNGKAVRVAYTLPIIIKPER